MQDEGINQRLLNALQNDKVEVLADVAQSYPDRANIEYLSSAATPGGPREPVPALRLAAYWGSAKVLRWLLDNGADVEARSNKDGLTALFQAAQWGRTDAVKVLLAAGADPTVTTPFGEDQSPVDAASLARWRGHSAAARLVEKAQKDRAAPRVLSAPKVSFRKR